MRFELLSIFIFAIFSCKQQVASTEIFAALPGGNIILDSIANDTVYLRPDNRDSEQVWFYWNFKATNTSNQEVVFKFNQKDVLTTFGPAYSIDGGNKWTWLFNAPSDQDYFVFDFGVSDSVHFCMAMPYLQTNFEIFCNSFIDSERFELGELAETRAARKIEKVTVYPKVRNAKVKALITARHHASEMMANYIMEGIIDEIISGVHLDFVDNHVEWIFVPFMDKDGVEQGDQGKHRRPRDHNRDYDKESIYASTRALRTQVTSRKGDLPFFALDLHNPWIKNDNNEITYLVGSAIPSIEKEQLIFNAILDSIQSGSLKFKKEHFMPFGDEWNTNSNYEKGVSFSGWAGQLPGILFASTLETPYANNEGQKITSETARSFGRDIAHAIDVYLKIKMVP